MKKLLVLAFTIMLFTSCVSTPSEPVVIDTATSITSDTTVPPVIIDTPEVDTVTIPVDTLK